jgi:hypothetical protein
MARIPVDPNYSAPTFPRATAGTDLFLKEDVQALAAAVSTHIHDGVGKGLPVAFTGVPAGSIPGTALEDGGVTSAKIADGTIATVDLKDGAVTNAKLASDTARANLLTNGSMDVWQRGVGPFAADTSGGKYTADRWIAQISGTNTNAVSRDTTNTSVGSSACAACAAVTGTGVSFLLQYVENQQLRGKQLTLSVSIKGAAAGQNFRLFWGDGSANTFGPSIATTTSHVTASLTFTLGTAATALIVGVSLDGTTTYYIDNAMLVVGSVPADYAPLHPADDLARCLRYYEVIAESGGTFSWQGYAAAGAIADIWVPYKARKPVAPTVTKNGTWTVSNAAQPSSPVNGVDGLSLRTTATALGGFQVFAAATGQNLSVESNP